MSRDSPRGVVHLEQILDVPSEEDVRSWIVSAREEALELRRWSPVVDREPSSSNSWSSERLDLPARGLLSRVMGISSRSRTASPPAEASLEREAQSAPSRSRFQYRWVLLGRW